MFRVVVADKVTSLTAAQAVSSALYAREKIQKDSTSGYQC